MIIKRCSDVALAEIVEAFNLGFSDYIIQHVWEEDAFKARFFGTEGNSPNYSFVAYEDNRPVGVVLGGIKAYDGRKTMRCGALCVAPSYRGSDVAHKLFEEHQKMAVEMGCKQLFLEVIKGNDRAYKFYEKKGYESIYNIRYYSHTVAALKDQQQSKVLKHDCDELTYKKKNLEALKDFRSSLADSHINWQCEPDLFSEDQGNFIISAELFGQVIGMAALNDTGKVYFAWVHPLHRSKGLATTLILKLAEMAKVKRLSLSTANNAVVTGYLKNKGFQKEALEQFEMYKIL